MYTRGREAGILWGTLHVSSICSEVGYCKVKSHFKQRNTKRFSSLQLLDAGTWSAALLCWRLQLRIPGEAICFCLEWGTGGKGSGCLGGEGWACPCREAVIAFRWSAFFLKWWAGQSEIKCVKLAEKRCHIITWRLFTRVWEKHCCHSNCSKDQLNFPRWTQKDSYPPSLPQNLPLPQRINNSIVSWSAIIRGPGGEPLWAEWSANLLRPTVGQRLNFISWESFETVKPVLTLQGNKACWKYSAKWWQRG